MGVRLAVFAAFLVLAGTADAAPARWTTAPPLLQARAAHAQMKQEMHRPSPRFPSLCYRARAGALLATQAPFFSVFPVAQ